MTQAIPDAATQAPFLVVTADLGDMPDLQLVGRYLDALGTLADYAVTLAFYSGIFNSSRDAKHAELVAEHLHETLRAGARHNPRRFRRDIPGEILPRLAVDRLRLASPLEAVLTAVAGDIKPLGYAVVALGLLKSGLGTVMDWQRHRAELRQMEWARDATSGAGSEMLSDAGLPEQVILAMQQQSRIPVRTTLAPDVNDAIKLIAWVPLVEVRREVTPDDVDQT
ncbi:hypothetical protein ACGF3C_19590 [Micromonospora sp. NPDC047762]|uniref:hypothetical protein n=1 Tax=Micromonospora sp. NPDC047762 TaxID=3364255 RepID=UPI00372302B6